MRQFAGLIHAEATRLIQLVEDILKLSRLDENRLPADRRRVSLKGLCEEAASRLAPEAEKRGVSIKVEGGECAMEGSPSMLGELVYNLLDNAVKYNRENGSVVAPAGRERRRQPQASPFPTPAWASTRRPGTRVRALLPRATAAVPARAARGWASPSSSTRRSRTGRRCRLAARSARAPASAWIFPRNIA